MAYLDDEGKWQDGPLPREGAEATCPKCKRRMFVRHEIADIEEYDLCIACDEAFNVRAFR